MPSGYLKRHVAIVGRKQARGGGSRQRPSPRSSEEGQYQQGRNKQRGRHHAPRWNREEDYEYFDKDLDFFWEDDPYTNVDDSNNCSRDHDRDLETNDRNHSSIGECPICFETRPLIPLLKSCWHSGACYDCLRQMLVTQAQKSVRNYPLRCFHPQCRLPIREAQLVRLRLIQCKEELTQHHRLTVLAQGYKGGSRVVTIHCPHCDHPRNYTDKHDSSLIAPRRRKSSSSFRARIFQCRECCGKFMVSPHNDVIRAIQDFLPDRMGGVEEGWAPCPGCNILISKGDGGDYVVCLMCGLDFSWNEAQRSIFPYELARPAHTDPRSFVHG